MTEKFQPKTEEAIKSEVLEDLGVEYEGNEEMVDKTVTRRLKDEDFKASVHKDKMEAREKLKETRKLAGLDPETGEKIISNEMKKEETEPNGNGLSAKDVIALRDIHEEDVDYLLDEAKLRGKTIIELKKDPYMKIILQTRAEERRTAEATATTSTRKSSKSDGENLLKKVDEYGLAPEEMREAAKAVIASMK